VIKGAAEDLGPGGGMPGLRREGCQRAQLLQAHGGGRENHEKTSFEQMNASA
jgi:hypothetical protein